MTLEEGPLDSARKIQIVINGVVHTIGPNVPPSTSLLQYIRETLYLSGTKQLCREGGCGACTVVATCLDSETGVPKTFSLQACQALVYACAGWKVETIEHLGDRFTGYHSLQKALVGFYGTQCGYCSPGMIMTMYGQLKQKGSVTVEQAEKSLDGNICRCTGYRPILDAFKSMATDAPEELKKRLVDIEDVYAAVCPNSGRPCNSMCSDTSNCNDFEVPDEFSEASGSVQWFKPATLSGLYSVLRKLGSDYKVQLVVGNTGKGVYKKDGPYNSYICTTGVKDLYEVSMQIPLKIGANVSIARCIEIFKDMAKKFPEYAHLEEISEHWLVVANVHVRNVASWGGNLMMKHNHNEFPSDIFLTLVAADAKLIIGSAATGTATEITIEDFLKEDLKKKIILAMVIPPFKNGVMVYTYKITPRAVNAHAYVNAAFCFTCDSRDGYKVSNPLIAFGGIGPTFLRASLTEKFLDGKKLTMNDTVVGAVLMLEKEIQPDNQPQDASPQYRLALCQNLLYKTIIKILGEEVPLYLRSGGEKLTRPVSSGKQTYDENMDSWPLGQGIPKLESFPQVSGEADYVDDAPPLPNEVHGIFVQSAYAVAKISHIDATAALKIPGVVDFVTAKDIPGENTFIHEAGVYPDPVFAEGKVTYAGQPLGLIIAERRDVALKAASLVKVSYSDIQKPVLTIKDALKEERVQDAMESCMDAPDILIVGDVEEELRKSPHQIEGDLLQGSQFHFTMEAHAARVIPTDDGFDVFCTTQWPNETQATVAKILKIPANSINLTVRRVGGAFGGKISRQHITSGAAAVAANKLKRPVRVTLDLYHHMTISGWRESFYSKYKVGFDGDGRLLAVQVEFISDAGYLRNEASVGYAVYNIPNVYQSKSWLLRPRVVTTDTAANTWCRTPGTVEAVATIENILEHIAHYLKKDPLQVRHVNLLDKNPPKVLKGPKGKNLVKTTLLPMIIKTAEIEARKMAVSAFNKANRWRKRGLSLIPLFYPLSYPSSMRFSTQVVIYEHDGSVVISHSGIEMGQGINTKVTQVAAAILRTPVDNIKVKGTNVFVGANSGVTGGSFGSDLNAHGVKVCCQKLREKLNSVEADMKKHNKKPPSWLELVQECFQRDLDMCERFWVAGKVHPEGYDIWGVCCLEVEVDLLTGQYLLTRADIIEDCGRSMSPLVDVGQVEGSFIMGLGLYSSELVKFDPATGAKLSNGTWEYKPPMALDIPVDFRVAFMPKGDNPFGVVRSKATGEPVVCMAYVLVTALRDALKSARADAGDKDWFNMDTPLTFEQVQLLSKVDPNSFRVSSENSDSERTIVKCGSLESDHMIDEVTDHSSSSSDNACSLH